MTSRAHTTPADIPPHTPRPEHSKRTHRTIKFEALKKAQVSCVPVTTVTSDKQPPTTQPLFKRSLLTGNTHREHSCTHTCPSRAHACTHTYAVTASATGASFLGAP